MSTQKTGINQNISGRNPKQHRNSERKKNHEEIPQKIIKYPKKTRNKSKHYKNRSKKIKKKSETFQEEI